MNRSLLLTLAPACALFVSACAPSTVQTDYEAATPLSRPDTILIYDFAVSADEVRLDRGLVGDVSYAKTGPARTAEQIDLGHKVADTISEALVSEINTMGLPAQRASGPATPSGNLLVVEGQIASIDEGNQAERVAIGLGTGASDVETRVQLYTATVPGLRVLETFTTSMKSGYMPGMAETMGAGAIGGHLAIAAAAGAGMHSVGEALGGDVEAEAKRTAKGIASQLRGYFEVQGWVAKKG